MVTKSQGEKGGVQTVETVLDVLDAFIGAEAMPMLKTIAERADMHPAKVHRYLASFCKSGHVRQDAESGRYRLGPAALRLGYAALNAVPAVPATRPVLKMLSETHRCSAFMALWSDGGPRIVLQEKEAATIAVAARVGSIFPLLTSATGRTFAAWLPRSITAGLLKKELFALAARPMQGCPTTAAEMEALFEDIRRRGLARATGQLSAAVHGLSAPIFDVKGSICAVITLMGPAEQFDTRWNTATAKSLSAAAADVTAVLERRDQEASAARGRRQS